RFRLEEAEVVDVRMTREADLAHHPQALRLGGDARELDAVGRLIELDAVEPGIKVKMPPRAAQLAIGRKLQPDLFLLLHQPFDLAILDRLNLLHLNPTSP